jgi:hypothetical protein
MLKSLLLKKRHIKIQAGKEIEQDLSTKSDKFRINKYKF